MMISMRKKRSLLVSASMWFFASPGFAAEEAKNVYPLGLQASAAGILPPPGVYASSVKYMYNGEASGSAALSRSFSAIGALSADVQVNADFRINASAAIDIMSMIWVSPQKVFGGHFGLGAILPVGYEDISATINARAAVTLPDGTTLGAARGLELTDQTFNVGDPLVTAFIGWSEGNLHWKLTGLLNIPVGAYDKASLVNVGFHRWAADVTGSLTWLDPKTGFEISLAPGFTFNGENPDTNYRTGTEFHAEAAVMQHFSQSVAIGLAAYHYRQLTADSGSGAILGSFKGEVTAVGPNLTYNFKVGSTPVFTSVRWLHEFNVKNRLEGDTGLLTVAIPLGATVNAAAASMK